MTSLPRTALLVLCTWPAACAAGGGPVTVEPKSPAQIETETQQTPRPDVVAAVTTAEPVRPPPGSHPIERAAELLARVTGPVEEACGARFRFPPEVVVLSPPQAREVFAQDLFTEVERRYALATPGQRATLLRMAADASVKSCLARYSFSTGAIVLVREGFERQRRAVGIPPERAEDLLLATLAHECVHALDDRRFDLEAVYAGAPDDESLRARAMVSEGRAVYFGRRAAAAVGVPQEIRNLLPGGADPRGEREFTLNLTYRLGARFVRKLVRRGGRELAEHALRRPPSQTHYVCRPSRWPDEKVDERPMALLTAIGLAKDAHPISELQLRARYAALHGPDVAATVFGEFRGGAQVLTDETNLAILAFASEEACRRYVELANDDAPTTQVGHLAVRAFGPNAEDLLDRVVVIGLATAPAVRSPHIRSCIPEPLPRSVRLR